jgi:hypothetical protein
MERLISSVIRLLIEHDEVVLGIVIVPCILLIRLQLRPYTSVTSKKRKKNLLKIKT